nr:hypothetical protein [Edwardsiella piscicida]
MTNDWVSVYFVKELGWDLVKSNSLVAWFEVGGILGGLTSGIISDRLFNADRWKTILIYSFVLIAGMIGVALTIHVHYYLVAICFFIIGAGIYAPQMLFALGSSRPPMPTAPGGNRPERRRDLHWCSDGWGAYRADRESLLLEWGLYPAGGHRHSSGAANHWHHRRG